MGAKNTTEATQLLMAQLQRAPAETDVELRLRAQDVLALILRSIDTCLANTHEGEGIFVLREQDVVAPGVVREWARRTHLATCMRVPGSPNDHDSDECQVKKVVEAHAVARLWVQSERKKKVAD
jgi:hypothetical protein